MNDSVAMIDSIPPLHSGRSGGIGMWVPYLAVTAMALGFSGAMITVRGSIAVGDEGPSLKLYHCILAVVGAGLLLRGRLARVRQEMVVYFSVTLTCSFLAAFAFGVQSRPLINAVMMIFAGVSGATLATSIGPTRTIGALRVAAGIFILAVVVKAVLNVQAFIIFFASPQGHPILPTFCTGGPNLEATWLALGALFFLGSAWFVPYAVLALAVSLLYASRVGVMLVVFAMLAAAARSIAIARVNGWSRGARMRMLAAASVLVALGAAAAIQYGDGLSYVVKRFQNIGDEPGSLGRLTLWRGGVAVFERHPLGVGQGNAVPALEHEIGTDVPENNLHNLYLQHLVETGLPGLVVYVAFAIVTWRRYVSGRFQDPLLAYVLGYLVISVIQFSGGDPILWFVWGLQTGTAAWPSAGAVT
jgi:O-antigen ligase